MMKHPGAWALLALVLAPPLALAQTPPPALAPRTPTGFSTIEQRYAYAPPNEGEFSFPLGLSAGAPRELLVMEPSMCNGSATAKVRYSKARNLVQVETEFHGLPYRMSASRPAGDDLSSPYNQFPTSVTEGRWQLWFVGKMFNFELTFYYDPVTLQLIGNEYDVPNPPANALAYKVNTMQMVAGPVFEGTPGGEAHVVFNFKYDQMLDDEGTGGVWFSYVPYNLCRPDEYGPYYTQGGLPPSKAMSFDDVLDSIHKGYGMAVAYSLEPFPRPSYLRSRDNPMIGWAGGYPARTPPGMEADPVDGTVRIQTECRTHVARPYAKAYYNLCYGR